MSKVTTAAPAAQTQVPQPAPVNFDAERQLQDLRNTISDMDCMSQEALGEIAAVAKLALLAMEVGEMSNPIRRELIAKALESIWSKAGSVRDSINATAEDAGCAYRDQAFIRRMAASR